MTAPAVQVDTREFQRFLVEYAAASNKDMADACNHQARNWALQTAKIAKKAASGRIAAQAKAEPLVWWTAWKIAEKTGGSALRKETYRLAKKKLSDRRRAVGFIRAFFLTLANAGQGFGSFAGLKGVQARRATPSDKTAELVASYNYKKRKGTTARKAESIMGSLLEKGLAATVRDMEAYLARKLGRRT